MLRARTILTCLGALLIVAAMVSAEGSGESASTAKVSLKMWDTASPERLPFQTEVIKAFMKEYPNAEVTFEGVPWGNYMEKVMTGVASGTAADAIRYTYVPDFAAKGMIMPLDEFIKKDKFDTTSFVRGAFGPTMVYDGKTYALPFAINYYGVFYNKDTFQKNALTEPKSLEEFVALCKKLTQKDAGGAFVSRAAQVIQGEDGMGANGQFLYMYGAKELAEQSQKSKSFLLNSPEGVKGLSLLSDLYRSGAFIPMENEQPIVSGNVAMRIADNSNGWQITQPGRYPNLKIDWFPVPKPQDMPKRIHTGIFRDAVFIPANVKNKEWAWRLTKWYGSAAGSGAVWQGKFGGVPPYNGITQKPPKVPVFEFYQKHEILTKIADAIQGGIDVQPMAMWYMPAKKIELVFNEEYVAAWEGRKAPAQALADMQRRVDEIIRSN